MCVREKGGEEGERIREEGGGEKELAIYTSVHALVLLVLLAVLPMIWFRLNLQVCSSVASFSACEQRIRMNSVVMSTTREERRTMIALQPMER